MIHDVEVRDLQVNAGERGHLVELFRENWDEYDIDPAMSYYSMTYPGIIRAWHRHLEGKTDHFVCPQGRIKVGVYDNHDDSPTQCELNPFVIREHNRQSIRIPGKCWHGFKAIGDEPPLLMNSPTNLSDYENFNDTRITISQTTALGG